MRASDLTTFESVLLLGLEEQSGKPTTGFLTMGLAGAIIADLAMMDRVTFAAEGKKTFVDVINVAPTGMGVLDEAINTLQQKSRKRRRVDDWVHRLSTTKQLQQKCAGRLLEAGVLRQEQKKVLLFRVERLPEANPSPETELRGWINHGLVGLPCTRQTATTIGIAYACHAIKPEGNRAEKKETKERVEQLTSGDLVSSAVKSAVEAALAAVMA